jgi:hypothetical protein
MTETKRERAERQRRAAQISAARAIVSIQRKLGEKSDPEIVRLARQTA